MNMSKIWGGHLTTFLKSGCFGMEWPNNNKKQQQQQKNMFCPCCLTDVSRFWNIFVIYLLHNFVSETVTKIIVKKCLIIIYLKSTLQTLIIRAEQLGNNKKFSL